MKAAIYCPDPETPVFTSGVVSCSGTASPSFVPDSSIGQLSSTDLYALMSALILALAIAAGWNAIMRFMGWK